MILAEKIARLRKQAAWSQEELAEKMGVSRQSISKWESNNSIPDLNKIILLSECFGVSTDYLLKDDEARTETVKDGTETRPFEVSLEQALDYVQTKVETSALVAKGVFLCICSPLPLFAMIALAKSDQFGLSKQLASGVGIVFILALVTVAISFFIRSDQLDKDIISIVEDENFELAYGVRAAVKEKLSHYKPQYNLRLSVAIALFIFCVLPIIFGNMIYNAPDERFMMFVFIIITFFMISLGVFIIISISGKFDAYNRVLVESAPATEKSKRQKRAEKFAAFYWPLLIAIYLGWSLWSMDWRVTWVLWPVGAVLFVALLGLMELLEKDE